MLSIIDSKTFLLRIVNNCPLVPSSKLDRTIKGIINNLEERTKEDLTLYLNKLRIVYYLKRLEYRAPKKAREYRGKSFLPLKTTYFLLTLLSTLSISLIGFLRL